MTEEYTVVQLNRQEELTLRIQAKLKEAESRFKESAGTVILPVQASSTIDPNCLASSFLQSDECDGSIYQERGVLMPKAKKKIGKKKIGKQKNAAVQEIQNAREGSKKAVILKLLQRPAGVTMEDLMAATAWQAHSVRGFLSAMVGKKMGLQLASSKRDDGQRVYQIR